jgi:hypothetical protein
MRKYNAYVKLVKSMLRELGYGFIKVKASKVVLNNIYETIKPFERKKCVQKSHELNSN